MASELRYDFYMRRLIRLTLVGLALGLFATVSAAGQINGVPASVTSIGFGGHGSKISGVPPSITSLGPNGFGSRSPFFNEPTCCINPLFPVNSNPRIFSRHHNHFSGFTGFVPFYGAPYAPVIVMQSPDDEQPATHPQLGAGQPQAAGLPQRLKHLIDQRPDLGGDHADRLRAAAQDARLGTVDGDDLHLAQ